MRTAFIAAFVIVLALTLAASFLVLSTMSNAQRIRTQGKIKAVGVAVYEDPALTVPLTEINWGVLEPGQEKNHTAYIKNESNVPVALFLATENWNPANASNFITLTWDYDGQPFEVSGFVEVTFTLTVDFDISGIETFSFDIVIVGSG